MIRDAKNCLGVGVKWSRLRTEQKKYIYYIVTCSVWSNYNKKSEWRLNGFQFKIGKKGHILNSILNNILSI